jgi:hypothetical protein
MAFDLSLFDTICFTVLSLSTVGSVCALISVGIAVVYHLELTPLDASILVWLIVALCISTFVLFSALFLNCCNLKYGKLVLACLYAAFDLFVLAVAIGVLALRPVVVEEIGALWTDVESTSLVVYLEEQFDCCGFYERPSHDCKERTQTCYDVIDSQLAQYSGVAGGVMLGMFVLLLVGVVISFIRALAKRGKPKETPKGREMAQIQEKLTHEGPSWF